MSENHQPPGLTDLLQRVASTGAGALQNRAELFSVECQQEKARLIGLLVWAGALVICGMSGVLLLTGAIILFCPEDWRPYVVGAFVLVYFGVSVWAWFALKKLLKLEPFSETISQLKRDGLCLRAKN